MSNTLGQNYNLVVTPLVTEVVFLKLVGPTSPASEFNPKGWGIVHTLASPINNQKWTITHNLNIPKHKLNVQAMYCYESVTTDTQNSATYIINVDNNSFDVQIGNGNDTDKDINIMVTILP
jgi:hypothetical protein